MRELQSPAWSRPTEATKRFQITSDTPIVLALNKPIDLVPAKGAGLLLARDKATKLPVVVLPCAPLHEDLAPEIAEGDALEGGVES